MTKIKSKMFLGITALLLLTGGSCPNGITTLTKTVDPRVWTVARTPASIIDITNDCSSASPSRPPTPDQWWNNITPGQPPKVAGQGVVGFNIWRNLHDGCRNSSKDLYRTQFTYDLSQLQALKGLVVSAELTFSAVVLPATPPNSFCQPMTGGGGSFLNLSTATPIPPTSFVMLSPPAQFQSGSKIFGMTFPWTNGSIPNSTSSATTIAGGIGGASFTVDVEKIVVDTLDAGRTNIVFSITGSDEDGLSPSNPPPTQFDCRTYYKIGQLTIKHV